MEQPYEITTNTNLLFWCITVAVELLILAALIPFPLILLLGIILINPVRAALAWRIPKGKPQPEGDQSPK